ncbi:MAG: 5-formyltetrahydrofolate cyclo-ligase [Beijerinckiaceae bacterium]|nr:5-formyltetrahydrofolate cyclo-ligase [Beijerinckiaceae bacterium]
MTTPSPDSSSSRKSALREAALARRDALEIDDRLIWDEAICERALALLDHILGPHPEEPPSGPAFGRPKDKLRGVSKDAPAHSGGSFETRPLAAPQVEGVGSGQGIPIVSGYWPMRSEADPRPILEGLHARGVPLCLPAIVDRRMIFRRWAPYEPIVPGGFGTLVPQPEQPLVMPTILLVPLAAFDRRGYRIGYGKGYYDALLAALAPVVAIGIAYGAQEIAAVPEERHDMRLDWVVTDGETIRCG